MRKFLDWGNGKGTFKPTRTQGTARRARLHDYARTLGMGSLRSAVSVPESENEQEWLAVNAVDLFNELSLLYGVVSDTAAGKYTKAGEGFPPGFEYRWMDGVRVKSPLRCSSPEYVAYVMNWVEAQLADESIFPTMEGAPFPPSFHEVIGNIFKRLFRVYAITYHSHFTTIEAVGAVEHLNTSFKHFMFFAFEFKLVPDKELKALSEPVQHMLEQYAAQNPAGRRRRALAKTLLVVQSGGRMLAKELLVIKSGGRMADEE